MDGAERADYFNPRSPHGERHGVNCRNAALDEISIHAPRTGSDRSYSGACALRTNFNPRSPHGERQQPQRAEIILGDISIHAPRTGSDRYITADFNRFAHFNPRSPHGERPTLPPWKRHESRRFQSTLPARGATLADVVPVPQLRISIHAPRTGSDADDKKGLQKHLDFNPRSPHGERHLDFSRLLQNL